jgi:hypothetical protein
MRAPTSLIAVLALVALAGCGGDPEAEASAAVAAYVDALRAGDAEAVCELLTEAELADLEAAGSCTDVFERAFSVLDEEGVRIPEYEIANVTVNGDSGEATLIAAATEEVLPLARENGEWLLAGSTSLAQIHPDDPLP